MMPIIIPYRKSETIQQYLLDNKLTHLIKLKPPRELKKRDKFTEVHIDRKFIKKNDANYTNFLEIISSIRIN